MLGDAGALSVVEAREQRQLLDVLDVHGPSLGVTAADPAQR
jgi:hypothetical protein